MALAEVDIPSSSAITAHQLVKLQALMERKVYKIYSSVIVNCVNVKAHFMPIISKIYWLQLPLETSTKHFRFIWRFNQEIVPEYSKLYEKLNCLAFFHLFSVLEKKKPKCPKLKPWPRFLGAL